MCLTINHSLDVKNPKKLLKTAKEDITVYKIIFTCDNSSMYHGFQYKSNVLYRLRKALVPKKDCDVYIVKKGFHSFKTKSASNKYFKCVEFTIPKGAKYYIGGNNDIVSTSIRSGSLEPIVL